MQHNYNVYCDESCHLENDHQKVMVLGAIWCPLDKARDIQRRIREIKHEYSLSPKFEIKWTKVSPAKVAFFQNLLDYFFDNSDLHFRALVVPDKSKLKHDEFGHSHDEWYYKMYFDLLKVIFLPSAGYKIYVDIKETHGIEKINKLHEVLCNNSYDFSREIIECIQPVRSHEVELVQLADLLIGAVSYVNRGLRESKAKLQLINRIQTMSGYSLTRTTLFGERKVNIFIWHPSWRKI